MSHDLTRFGLRYFQDEDHYTQADWNTWGQAFSKLGIKWLSLTATERRAIPESFLRSVIDGGIQPIVHVASDIGSISLRDIAPILKSYADWGIRQVIVFDRPNMQSSWNPSDWSRSALVDRFVDIILPLLHVQLEVGLRPILPPFEPGGDYWDTAFLETILSVIQRRGQLDLLRQLGLSVYAWTNGRHINWGKGGPKAWPQAKPYRLPLGAENQIGIRIYEWYQAIMEHTTGFEAPIFVLAGGFCHGMQNSDKDPRVTQTDIFNQLQSDEVPTYVKCFNFDAFATPITSHQQWFNADGSFGDMSIAILEAQRKQLKIKHSKLPKTLEHYALIPSGTDHGSSSWDKIAQFAMSVRPTIGFSVEEALHARKVTILAGEDEIPPEIEWQLQDSECEVNRINIRTEDKLLDAITAFAIENNQAGGKNE